MAEIQHPCGFAQHQAEGTKRGRSGDKVGTFLDDEIYSIIHLLHLSSASAHSLGLTETLPDCCDCIGK